MLDSLTWLEIRDLWSALELNRLFSAAYSTFDVTDDDTLFQLDLFVCTFARDALLEVWVWAV